MDSRTDDRQTFSSSRVNPRPARTRVWYLKVGQWTIGRNGPATGLGIIAAAFFLRLSRRRCFRAGWLNQQRTNRCQSLWKWPLGIMLLPFPMFANLSINHARHKLAKRPFKKQKMLLHPNSKYNNFKIMCAIVIILHYKWEDYTFSTLINLLLQLERSTKKL